MKLRDYTFDAETKSISADQRVLMCEDAIDGDTAWIGFEHHVPVELVDQANYAKDLDAAVRVVFACGIKIESDSPDSPKLLMALANLMERGKA